MSRNPKDKLKSLTVRLTEDDWKKLRLLRAWSDTTYRDLVSAMIAAEFVARTESE